MYNGCLSADSTVFFRDLEARRRAERSTILADREAERAGLEAAERAFIEVDAPYDGLATAALLATEHHRPQWGQTTSTGPLIPRSLRPPPRWPGPTP